MDDGRKDPTISDYIQAGYPCLFLRTVEPMVVEQEVHEAVLSLGMGNVDFAVWKATTGLLKGRADTYYSQDAQEVAKDLADALGYIETQTQPIVGVFHNLRQFVNNYAIIQQMIDTIMAARLRGSHVILLGPHLELPPELKNLVTFYECPLPTKVQIKEEYEKIVKAYEDEIKDLPADKEEFDSLMLSASNAAVGLDMMGAENAIALSLATSTGIDIPIIQSQKEQEVRKSDVLEFFPTTESMKTVGGFNELKDWLQRREKVFTDEARAYGLPYPKGMLIVGPAGCTAGDTLLPFRRGKRNSGRMLRIEDAYYKFNRIPRNEGRSGSQYLWNKEIPTQTLSVLDDGVVGYNEIQEIVYTGKKELFAVTASNGETLKVTSEHPFRVQDGTYVPLNKLAVGSTVMVRDMSPGLGRTVFSSNRRVAENIPFHPNAYDHWVGYDGPTDYVEYNYKRINYAVIVVEAAMNGMSVAQFIRIIRHSPKKAQELQYVAKGLVVHHKDFDCENDDQENLEVLSKTEHDTLHGAHNRKNMRYSTLTGAELVSIVSCGVQKTYDLIMMNPHRNYMAHSFAVHNTGKSLVAKAVATELRLPLLRLDMGKVFRSLVGDSESAIRLALKVAEAVSPVVLWLDEIDKALAGMKGSGELDSGVTARVVSTVLTWRQETTYPVMLVATANDVATLPSMVYRKGRLDEVWATDLPFEQERVEIFEIHLTKRKRDPKLFDVDVLASLTDGWTGSEIESSIEDAMFSAFDKGKEVETKHIARAIKETTPQSIRDKEELKAIRDWAKTRARMVSKPSKAGRTKGKVRQLKTAK